MPDEADPPRKFYALKPKEFERVNQPPREAAPPPDLRPDPGIKRTEKERIDVRDIARIAAHGTPLLGGTNAPANRHNEIHAVLRENHEIATAAGLNNVALTKKRRSRRARDYWLSMLVGNAVLLACLPLQPIFAGAGIVLFNTGFAWFMWVVMDDY